MNVNKDTVGWWISLSVLFLSAYWIQSHMALHQDIVILSHTAKVMLQGHTYGEGIFEPNPPLIFYLHAIPVLIAQWTGINILHVLYGYMFFWIAVSISCLRILIKNLFYTNGWIYYPLLYGLLYIFLFLPAEAFAQREHLLLMFTLPYLFLAACRLDNQHVHPGFAAVLGIMGGIGFSIKPFFLPAWIFIELFFIIRGKKITAALRTESVCAGLIILLYNLSVPLLYPAYIRDVLPLWYPFYRAIMKPWQALFLNFYSEFCWVSLICMSWIQKQDPDAPIKRVLQLGGFGFFITYLLPGAPWFYHIMPAFSVCILYWIIRCGESLKRISELSFRAWDTWLRVAITLCLSVMIFSLPAMHSMVLLPYFTRQFASDNALKRLASFLDTHAPHNSYDFLSMNHALYKLEFYSTARFVGSFSFCNWEYTRLAPAIYSPSYRQAMLSYVLNIMSQDLNIQKPDFVLIDTATAPHYLGFAIDYVKDYTQHPDFRRAFSHYQYITAIAPFEIYRRIS